MTRKKAKGGSEGLNALGTVDKLVHEPSRLMILGILSMVEEADFLFLLNQTGMTKGNLSTHLRKLENAGYIAIHKEFISRMPHTVLKITKSGTAALAAYRATMAEVIGSLVQN
jgi:DNA-binding transcriptional ArsR family regulator